MEGAGSSLITDYVLKVRWREINLAKYIYEGPKLVKNLLVFIKHC